MKKDKVYYEEVPGRDYEVPKCWAACFVDSPENDYTFYPAIVFGDDLETQYESGTGYVFDWKTALRIGIRITEYSLRCALYKARKRAPKTFKPWFK